MKDNSKALVFRRGCLFYLPACYVKVTICRMAKEIDIDKALRQHVEMENFFSDGVMPRGKQKKTAAQAETCKVCSSTAHAVGSNNSDVLDAQTELNKIAAELTKCCKCGLGKTRKHVVAGEGNPQARLMFVGEAPGADEDEQGRPFVGRSGQLLTKIIEAMGLKREDVYIANIIKCRPPDNRDPKPEEIIKCLPILKRQIEIINPDIIVALGAHAARTLLNTNEPIGQLRGVIRDFEITPGGRVAKFMATYHPSYLLRNYSVDNRKRVWEDMQKVLKYLGLPVPDKKAEN